MSSPMRSRAAIVREVGGDWLVEEFELDPPRAGEVLIEIKAASLNFPDILIVQNKYQMKPPLPFVPGSGNEFGLE